MTAGHRRAVALRGALVASVAVLLALPSAGIAAGSVRTAPAAGACSDSKGVTVVVDFGALGGGTKVRCAPAPVTDGFGALRRAGFVPEGTHDFPGLLCRIDGKPSADEDSCRRAPSQERYWSYWYAPRGGEWTYSSSGAGSRTPPPGSVEGWAFGSSDRPSIDPPARNAPATTTTRPGATTTTSRAGSPTTATASPSPTTSAAGDGSPSTTTLASDGTTTGDTVEADDATTTTSSASDELAGSADDAPGPSDPGDGGGSPVGVLVAVVAVGALGTAAWVRSRRPGPGAP